MPKKVPAEFTGRFSVKPKQSSSRSKKVASASPPHEEEAIPLRNTLRDDPTPIQERKRKSSGDSGQEGEGSSSVENRDDVEELDTYIQQLEVQPPFKKRIVQVTEQTEPQDQLAAISDHTGRSESQAEHWARDREPETLPGPREHHGYQEEALAIIKDGWQSHDRPQSGIEVAAQALANRAANVPDAETLLFPRYVARAMLEHASQQPQALDFMLLVFSEVIKLLPDSLVNKHSSGSDTTISALKWLLIGESSGFDGFLLPNSTATIDVEDRSDLNFQPGQVNANLEGVLSQIRDWGFQRKLWFISSATQARCFSLEILRRKLGQKIESDIDDGLNRKQGRWSKADMIGACILLRGCAKSLKAEVPSCRIKIFAWKASLEKFLLQDEDSWNNDFAIKAHAAVRETSLACKYPCRSG